MKYDFYDKNMSIYAIPFARALVAGSGHAQHLSRPSFIHAEKWLTEMKRLSLS
jgi:hypothetical protein